MAIAEMNPILPVHLRQNNSVTREQGDTSQHRSCRTIETSSLLRKNREREPREHGKYLKKRRAGGAVLLLHLSDDDHHFMQAKRWRR